MTAPKKVILLIIDTLRADHLGCYGYERDTSPNIDRLAAHSIFFSHAFTPVSYTLPAIASLLTSKRPDSHGIGLSQIGKLSEDSDLTLAEVLRDKGYATAAFVSTIVLSSATKLNAGFDLYDDDVTTGELNRPDYLLRDGQETIARALEYIKNQKENNLFTFIHLMDVHGPYICPPPYDALFIGDSYYGEKETLNVVPDNHPWYGIPGYQVLGAPGAAMGDYTGLIDDARYYRARYDGCIRKCDAIVAPLLEGLKTLGIYDDTLFILTADHGEALGENGIYFFHGVTVTPEQIHVPLIIKPQTDSLSMPKKLATRVSTMDLMPTILSACGIDLSDLDLHGSPLQTLIERGADPHLLDRTLLSVNECQDALISPNETLELQRSTRPFCGHYAFVPELIDRLDGRQYNWKTGKEIPIATVARKSRMMQLRQAFRDEPLSLKKLVHITYLLSSIGLPPTVKHMILSMAPQLKTRFGPRSGLLPSNSNEIPPCVVSEPGHLHEVCPTPSSKGTEAGIQKNTGNLPGNFWRGLKVAIFVHCFFPRHYFGTETYTLQLADNLRRMGHQPIVVAATFPGEPRQHRLVTQYVYHGIPVYNIDMNYIPPGSLRETYYHESLRGVFRDLLRQIRPDIVHVTHLINLTGVLPEVVDSLGLPMVATMTDFFGFCFNCRLQTVDGSVCPGPNADRTNCIACFLRTSGRSLRGRIAAKWPTLAARGLDAMSRIPILKVHPYAEMAQDLKARPDILAAQYAKYRAVIAPTRFLHEAYAANGLKPPCFDIPYGVDLPRDPKPERRNGQALTFGFMGQIAHHKGTDLLVDAFSMLPHGAAALRIHGPEDQDPGFMANLKRAAVGHSVSFQGPYSFEKTYEVLRDLDVLVIPSRWGENGPLVLLNALATHTPVIVSDAGGLTEFIEEGRSGFKFDTGSATALKQVMQRFMEERQLAMQLSQSTEYPWTSRAMVEEVLKVYELVLN